MKILISGSRYYTNYNKIYEIFKRLPEDTCIIHGDCVGADKLAESVAIKLNFKCIAYPANWSKGKSGGPLRNQQMLDENPDIERAIIFHECLENSKGTKDMIKRLEKKKISFLIFD